MLYVPAGDLFVERASRIHSSFGVKLAVCKPSTGNLDAPQKIKIAKEKFKKDIFL